MKHWLLYTLSLIVCLNGPYMSVQGAPEDTDILPAATQFDQYLPLLKGKKVALLINQTSRVGDELLLDVLLKRHVHIVKIFVPEHGLRGQEDAGATVKGSVDKTTGIPIVSLYGDNVKPKKEQLADIDVLVYDLQDVGVRYFTYISTLQYAMQACAENNKLFVVLDLPDPNGHYVDGPVLDTSCRSFVGMQPIPIVYGMTPGEYAKMLQGQHMFPHAAALQLKVIPCRNYDHTKMYKLPVPPSPNLKEMAAVYMCPSICLFEGTVMSVGRGTAMPFQLWGHPDLIGKTIFSFTPVGSIGAAHPIYEGRVCYGQVVAVNAGEALQLTRGMLRLTWLLRAYQLYPYPDKFFSSYFEKLAGNKVLRKQIQKGMSEEEIRASWKPGLTAFKAIRKKYLLYKDFK